MQIHARTIALAYGVELLSTYSSSLLGFSISATEKSVARIAQDERVRDIFVGSKPNSICIGSAEFNGFSCDSNAKIQGEDCPYDYCGHMVVTGFVIKMVYDNSGQVPPGVHVETPDVDGLPDLFENVLLPFKDIPRKSGGDPDVNCSSEEEVRIGEAGTQIGLDLLNLKIGDIVRVNYGNGQSELFQIVNTLSTMPGVPVPTTCR